MEARGSRGLGRFGTWRGNDTFPHPTVLGVREGADEKEDE